VKEMKNALRKVWAGIFILIMVLGVAAVWRLALQKEGQEEMSETAESYEEEGVIYRFSDKDPGAYVFIRDHEGDGYREDYVDAINTHPDEDDIYGENGEHITEAELETGDRVKVISSGEILETYPGTYVKVFRMEIIKKADEAEREACIERYGEALAWCYQEPDPSEPPVVQLIYSEGETETCLFPERGGYQWSWETEDGQRETAAADTAFISEWEQIMGNPMTPVTGKVEIHATKEGADVVTVTRWPEEVRDMEEKPEGEHVPVENLDGKWYVTGMEGGYYYLMRVCWGEDYVEYGILCKDVPDASGQAAEEGILEEAPAETGATSLPEGVTMTVTSLTNGTAAVKIENRSGGEIEYGTSYGLQKEIEGKWHTLPITGTNVEFDAVALILGDQGKAEENCDLTIFGELGEGKYRLVKDGMTAVFSLDENGKLR